MNIPTSLIVVLLVVAWLAVLVPMVARRRERVPQSEPAGANFRVLRRASATLRRRPSRGAKGRTMTEMDQRGERADTEEIPVVVGAGQEPADAAEEWAAAQASARARRTGPLSGSSPVQFPGNNGTAAVDETDDARLPAEPVEQNERFQPPTLVTANTDDENVDTDLGAVEPQWEQPRDSIPDEIDEQEWADHVAAAPPPADPSTFADVDAEQLRPVPRRPGRGGFDPEAAEATRAFRYQQRRRVAMILLIATVAFALGAALAISWLWVGAAVSLALLVGYLTYLRRQVKIEAAIRQRRMERLQRSRQIRPEYARPPQRTRGGMSAVAPGRTVVDLDDDDPGFDELEDYQQPVTYRRAAGQ